MAYVSRRLTLTISRPIRRTEQPGERTVTEVETKHTRLTKPLLVAMAYALNAALAGEGFDGGDFDGEKREHYERALAWVEQELAKRARAEGTR